MPVKKKAQPKKTEKPKKKVTAKKKFPAGSGNGQVKPKKKRYT